MIKKLILMVLMSFSLLAVDNLEENFGPLIKIGVYRFQDSKIYIKSDNGSFKIIADSNEFIVNQNEVAAFYINKGRVAYGNFIYNNVTIEKNDANTLLALSKNGSSFGRYRGNFDLIIIDKKILPINKIYAEEYLYSVVPSEIGNNFPDEAIKAQSVAARTYLFFGLSNQKYSYCDLLDNVNSQMYLGYDKENSRINSLINETFNEILTYNGKVIQALFHSTSGGKTASNESVWPSGKPIPYLRSVNDSDNGKISPKQNWTLVVGKNELNNLVGYKVNDINILETDNDRVKYLELTGEKIQKLTGEGLRKILGVNKLNSTMFTVKDDGDNFIFEGSGFGHGLGMPQYSAYTMAQNGKKYIDILNYYYTGVKLSKVKE